MPDLAPMQSGATPNPSVADLLVLTSWHAPAPGELRASATVQTDHPLLAGHFPGMPVVPGVCQVQAVSRLLALALPSRYQLVQAPQIKFLGAWLPNKQATAEFVLNWRAEPDGALQVHVTLGTPEVVFMKLRGLYHTHMPNG